MLMRSYEQTHPWLQFRIDLEKLDYEKWFLLGKAQSMCEYLARMPLFPDTAEKLHQIYLARGIRATTAIEGNTLTENEVLDIIQHDKKLPLSKDYQRQEVVNVLEASNLVLNQITHGSSTQLDPEHIKTFNRIILQHLPLKEEIVIGEFRLHDVRVEAYKGVAPEDVGYLVNRLCEWLNTGFAVKEELKMAIGILKAIIAHLYIAWIHPFGDGNGRTARLIELQILLSVGVPSPAAHLLSNHYNATRSEYYLYLDRASRDTANGFSQFVAYALRGLVDQLAQQIEIIEAQQLAVHWESFVYDNFHDRDSKTDIRQRHLVLDLLRAGNEAVPFNQIRHITPRIAEAYAGMTDRTILRDLEKLEQQDLVRRTTQGYRANIEILLSLMPRQRRE
jgi:Fic family protein